MDKLETLCRAWIDCDPNRQGAEKGSGFHPDDILPTHQTIENRDKNGRVTGISTEGVGEDLEGKPRWRWFLPRAVALEQYLEERGWAIVKLEQVKQP